MLTPSERREKQRRIVQRMNAEAHVWRQKSIVNQVRNPLFADRLWGDGGDLREAGKIISRHDPMRDWDIADSIPVTQQDNSLRGGLDYRERLKLQSKLLKAGIPLGDPRISRQRLTYMIVKYLRENPQVVHNAVVETRRYQRNMKSRSIVKCHQRMQNKRTRVKTTRYMKKRLSNGVDQPALFKEDANGHFSVV